jgi:NhaA family Na+:H+ antiporter
MKADTYNQDMSRRTVLPAWLVRPIEAFTRTEALGGGLLALAAVVALLWANSAWQESYRQIWATPVRVGAPGFELNKPLLIWINDLLMAVFFLLVGLEIKRELVAGELSSLRKAALPVAAAVGGMVAPALIFLSVAGGEPVRRGWGIAMATDIAFALGCLRVLGSRVPTSLLVLLTALAIIDDLGAILVIALFYTGQLSVAALAAAAVLVLGLALMNAGGVRSPVWYLFAGLFLWLAVLKSGMHPTLAGVIVAFAVPARARYSRNELIEQAETWLRDARTEDSQGAGRSLEALRYCLRECESPLTRLEHALHPWVAYGILPLFALANAGVDLAGVTVSALATPVAGGVFLGLFLGKQLGVIVASWLAVRAGWAELPEGVAWKHVYGMGLLAGIGFTMALFIAALAYGEGSPLHQQAKIGILTASLVSAIAGVLVLGLAADPSGDRRS